MLGLVEITTAARGVKETDCIVVKKKKMKLKQNLTKIWDNIYFWLWVNILLFIFTVGCSAFFLWAAYSGWYLKIATTYPDIELCNFAIRQGLIFGIPMLCCAISHLIQIIKILKQ